MDSRISKMWRIFLFVIFPGLSLAYRITENGFSTILRKHLNLNESIFIEQAPYVASIESDDDFIPQRIGIAIILTSRFVITSRDIYSRDKAKIKVVIGTTDLNKSKNTNKFTVNNIMCPQSIKVPKRKKLTYVSLRCEIQFNEFQKPIALIKSEDIKDLKFEDAKADLKIVGYGRRQMDHNEPYNCMGDLRKLEIVTEAINLTGPKFKLTTGEYTCSGDIGTPAIWKNKLIGIVKDGPQCEENESNNNRVCNKAIFTGIIYCLKWLENTIGDINLQQAANSYFQEPSFGNLNSE